MDKNIAALLREDTRTVHVSFDMGMADFDDIDEAPVVKVAGSKPPMGKTGRGPRLYTYVTHLGLHPGDTVVVQAAGEIKLATVIRVDDDVTIEPNSNVAYQWVIDKVDIAAYDENQRRNDEITRTVGEAYRNNLRRSFAQSVLAAVDESRRDGLAKLLSGS